MHWVDLHERLCPCSENLCTRIAGSRTRADSNPQFAQFSDMLPDQIIAAGFAQRRAPSGIRLFGKEHLMDEDEKCVGESAERFLPSAVASPPPKFLT